MLVGWSMGALVLWNYVLQWGRGQARGMVFVGQSASDLRTPAYEDGIVTPEEFHQMMLRLQTDREALLDEWMRAMRMYATEDELAWMVADYLRCPAHIATVAFYHQTTVNSLPAFPADRFPDPRVFRHRSQDVRHPQGEYLARAIPGTQLVVFDRSGHVPMLEEPDKFNPRDRSLRRICRPGPALVLGLSSSVRRAAATRPLVVADCWPRRSRASPAALRGRRIGMTCSANRCICSFVLLGGEAAHLQPGQEAEVFVADLARES